MPRPNLFIVGAPRCGTTSLYRYLQQHPDVFMSANKAPNYWSADVFGARHRMSEEAYLALFAGAKEQRWRGEASVSYLYSQEAARGIRAFSPDARIIVMLRNPVDMMYSLHHRRLELGHEPLLDFEAALAAELPRQQGQKAGGTGLYRYSAVGAYAGQLQRYFDAFGRERVHVIIYDDFQRDTLASFRQTLRFLEVREDVPVDLTPVNEGVHLRSGALYRLSSQLWRSRVGALLGDVLHRLNKAPGRPPRLRPELRERLTSQLGPEVERLGQLLGRDLSSWSRPAQG